jgi:hypothetical protein
MTNIERESTLGARLKVARLAKRDRQNDEGRAPKVPARASRYYHRLSCGKRIHVAIWQLHDGRFEAMVRGTSETFLGETWSEAFVRLAAHFEGVALSNVKIAR